MFVIFHYNLFCYRYILRHVWNLLFALELVHYYFFFFQAEDGIRDLTVTGVQTCALPILRTISSAPRSSSKCARVLQPGIGMISGPFAIAQASAIWAVVADFSFAMASS